MAMAKKAAAKKPKATANYRGSGMGPTAYSARKNSKAMKEYLPKYFTPAEYDALMAKQAKASKLGPKAQKAGKAQKARRTTRSADPTPGRAPGR